MTYNISINQKAIVDNKWEMEITQWVMFDVFYKLITGGKFLKKIIDFEKEWVWIDYNLIQKEIVLFSRADNWYRDTFKKLASYNLVEIHPNNQKLAKTYFRLGGDCYKMFFFGINNEETRPPLSTVEVIKTSTIHSVTPPLSTVDNNNTYYNKEEEEVKVPQFILPALPELEEIKKFSAGAKNSAIWYESTCIAMSLKKEALFEWMDLFDVHISNTNEVRGIDARKYKSLLMGWIRSQNAQGKTLQSYKSTQPNNNVRTASNQQQYGSYQSKNGKNAQSHTGRTIIHDKP